MMDINTRNLIDSLSARVNELQTQLAEKEEQLLTREDEKALFIGLNKGLKTQLAEEKAEGKRVKEALRELILSECLLPRHKCPVCGGRRSKIWGGMKWVYTEQHNQVEYQDEMVDCPVKEVL